METVNVCSLPFTPIDETPLERFRSWLGLAALALLGWTGACSNALTDAPHPPPTVVPHVDLQRYVGRWYEIARYPNRFQKGCVASTAEYALLEDGRIRVRNACRRGSVDGPLREAIGKAWVVDPSTNAKLKVQFFWPFRGDYWIIDLGEDYAYAVVGHPRRKYLWILSREPTMASDVYEGIVRRLIDQGYDPERLRRFPPAG